MNPVVLAEVEALLSHLAAAPSARGASHADDILAHFDEVDAKLVAKGFPATSPWWRETFGRWYATKPRRRQLVVRAGRRGGKSSSLSRLSVVEALYGHHDVPPGDVGTVAIISTRKDEAAARLNTIKAILDALGVAYVPWGEAINGIRLVGRRIGFRVFSASVQGVSGFTAIFVIADEVAKWKDADTGVNPATEVIASVRPTMQTMRNARMVLSSSPFSVLDAHYDAFEEGDTERQIVAYAPTWVANPTVTEAETRIEEPNEKVWLREYKGVPQAEVESSLLSDEEITSVTRKKTPGDLPYDPSWRYTATMDPATRSNAWTLTIAGQSPKGVRHITLARQWVPKRGDPLKPEVVLLEVSELMAIYKLRLVVTDQKATDYLRAIIRVMLIADPTWQRIFLHEEAWTADNKGIAFEFLAKLIQARKVGLPADKFVRADLLGIVKKITRSGVSYHLVERNGRHSDYAPSIALAVQDARFPAVVPEPTRDVQKQAEHEKREFLRTREIERKREQRLGRLPATHRKRKAA